MIRVTREQAATLFDNLESASDRPAPRKTGKPRVKRRKQDLPENQIESQIRGFLASRNWTVTRNHVGSFIPTGVVMRLLESGQPLTKEILFRSIVRVGEKGDPDWRAERVVTVPGHVVGMEKVPYLMGTVQLMLIECKAPGRKPSPEQRKRIEDLQALGWVAEYFDDFDEFPGPHSFCSWYRDRYGEI